MSNEPEPDDDALLERYRRASAAEPLAPTDAVRATILAEAARLAAAQRPAPALTLFDTSVPAANQWRWQLMAFGTVAAAVIAAILVEPQFRGSAPPTNERAAADLRTDARMADAARTSAALPAVEPAVPTAPPEPVARVDSPAEQARRHLEPVDSPAFKAATPPTPDPFPSRQAPANGDTVAALRRAPARLESTTNGFVEPARVAAQELRDSAAAAAPPAAAGAVAGSAAQPSTAKQAIALSNPTATAPAPATAENRAAAIHRACELGDTVAIEKLLAAGAPLESHDPRGHTPLMIAAANGRIDAVRLLLARGASAKAVDREGQDATALARSAGFEAVAAEIERNVHH